MNWKDMELSGWGRSSRARVEACRPERQADLAGALNPAAPNGLIAHGAGRSYGDAALNHNGRVALTARLDRILSFDPASGETVCEPGVTFRDLLAAFLPRGFMPPASPGTAFATIGGAVAADVHGKNHDRHGSFGDHVLWLDLMVADGTTRRLSPTSESDLFAATIGGMGLTGIVRAACFRMLPSAAPTVRVKERRIAGLDAFLAAFAEVRETATFSVGWIDALARGAEFGRGILETAEFEPAIPPPPAGRAKRVPVDFPGFILNPLTVRLFNRAYYARVPAAGRERFARFETFLYPLDALYDWNRIYGRAGFYQFQCVLPDAEAPAGLRALLEEIGRAGNASFLAVLKTLGSAGRGHLSFPMRGFTLALDIPRRSGTDDLMARLERIVRDRGGRIYLAKDATLSPEGFRAMYPKLPRFLETLGRVDPAAVFASDLARRLAIRPAGSQ
ncbi:MAG: FAD-binding oxidoreductase [Rhodospirillales bacterium]|nr:FAD-binding oxidoreductase [Rhodospirillales bacterium]